jgi:hypothetical protein
MADPIKQLTELLKQQGLPATGQSAADWFRKAIKRMEGHEKSNLIEDRRGIFRNRKKVGVIRTGEMYMFRYIPKGRNTLKYYDEYPLVIVTSKGDDYFRGLNLHYLPHKYRAIFFTNLQSYISNHNYDGNTRLRVTKRMINTMSKFRFGKVCYRTYSLNQIRSKMVKIHSREWFASLFLPTESFVPPIKSTIWKESRRKIIDENR